MILFNSWIIWLEETHQTWLFVSASLDRTRYGMFNLWDVFPWESAVFEYVETTNRSSRPEVFYKKVFLEISQNSQENTCARVSFLIKLHTKANNFIKKETLTQMFSSAFWEIFKNTFYYKTPPMAAPESDWFYQSFCRLCVPTMFANLNMNDNNRKIGLDKKEMVY